jgi:prepilin-type N-terminal cleavage/methylation domain-containing protein
MKFFINKKENNSGFTLIEVMISIGLFTVIMIIGITAILGVNNTYRKNRSMRSAVDNMSFIMEDMARNIRLGSRYRCLNSTGDIAPTTLEDPLDGLNCAGIAFEPFYNPIPGEEENLATADQVIYLITQEGDIFKGIEGANFVDTALPMNSIDLKIDTDRSGFTISGTGDTDNEQPAVLMRIAGTASTGRNSTDFNLQTTVTQRLLDAPSNP